MSATQNFVANLGDYLAKRGVSQRELAKLMGIKHPYISRVLAGHSVPTLDFVDKVADAIGVSGESLIAKPQKRGKN